MIRGSMPSHPPDSAPTDGHAPEPTPPVDPILVEGMRIRAEGAPADWSRFLQRYPDHAARLEALVSGLESVGLSPRKHGAFEALDELGQGGMGIVWRCRRASDGKLFAVKVVRPELLVAPSTRERFVREVRTLRALAHPGIVAIEDVDDRAAAPWFAMELVDGESLERILRRGQASGAQHPAEGSLRALGTTQTGQETPAATWIRGVLRVVLQVAEALACAHEHGVVHRDVKPSNILVTPSGRAVLIDFGLARPADSTTITADGAEIGSLPYMAPELLNGLCEPDARTDVYALGVTMYQALCLASPFQTATAEGTRRAILRAMPLPLRRANSAVGDAVASVCQVAMDRDPRRRYASAALFAEDLKRVLAGTRPVARAPGAPLRTLRWIQRNPGLASAALAFVSLVVVLPSTIAWQQSRALAANLRLSDLHLAQDLTERERALWPARPERLPGPEGMDAWLAQTAEVVGRRSAHLAELAALQRRATPLTETEAIRRSDAARRIHEEIGRLEHNVATARSERMAGWEDWIEQLDATLRPLRRRLREVYGHALATDDDLTAFRRLAELAIDIDELEMASHRVQERRAHALAWAERSLVDAAPAWRSTLAAIADREANPRYRGLRLEPQFGLVPLGKDPHSGLFEFAHLPSGAPAVRDEGGHLQIDETTGIVLVLLVGGPTRVGADLLPTGPHYDAAAREEETPSIVVRLHPYFLSKYELTIGQWRRHAGHFAGRWKPGFLPSRGAEPITALHPVYPVSVRSASTLLMQLGLALPTGAQWENGARGGTTDPWWTGPDPRSLQGAENLFDATTRALTDQSNALPTAVTGLQDADAWPFTAPVAALRPNPFGLHHVLGNAPELCVDAARSLRLPMRDGDGCTDNVDNGSLRLGSFGCLPGSARVTRRGDLGYDTEEGGVRPMRRIEGAWTVLTDSSPTK